MTTKKVRKQDLIILIAMCYINFIDPEQKPINDIIDGHGDIKLILAHQLP